MGVLNAHIGLREGESTNTSRDGQRLMSLVWVGDLVIEIELPKCIGEMEMEMHGENIGNRLILKKL